MKPSIFQCAPTQNYLYIELIISIFTILLLISIVTIVHYPHAIKRMNFLEGSILADDLIQNYFNQHYSVYGQLPDNLEQFQAVREFRTQGRYTQSIGIKKSAITITPLQNPTDSLTFRPALLGDTFTRMISVCGYAQPPAQSVIYGGNQTNLSPDVLLHVCR